MSHRHHHHDRDGMDERELLIAILLVLEEIADELLPASTEPVTATIAFEGGSMSDITVPASQTSLTATVAYLDANGAPVQPVSVPVWTSSDESIATVDASADPTGLTAAVTMFGTAGSATIDADTTNTDGTVVVGSGTVTVEAAAAPEPATGDVTFA